jgi:radical SAM protein with 4Fe4S-binding SPASM domain
MYSPFRHSGSIFSKKNPIHLTFFITRRCNSRCPFCFYLKTPQRPPESEELSLEEIRRISHSMGDLLWLAFSGGEIFLRDDLVAMSRIFYDQNRPVIMLYPTNGLLPQVIREQTEEILRYCRESVITVKLSLDGLGDAHDRIRNTPGSFERTMETYDLLKGLMDRYPHFELGMNTVFCSENQDTMDEIIGFVNGLDQIKTHTISLIRGDLSDQDYKRVDYSKYHNAVERLEHNLKNRVSRVYRFRGARIKAAQDILQRRLIHQTMVEGRRLIPCYAGRLNLVLTESGDVYPCEILSEPLGNVREHGYEMEKVIRSEQAAEVILKIMKNKCFCTHECYFMTNILFNPMLYPALAREYLYLSR